VGKDDGLGWSSSLIALAVTLSSYVSPKGQRHIKAFAPDSAAPERTIGFSIAKIDAPLPPGHEREQRHLGFDLDVTVPPNASPRR